MVFRDAELWRLDFAEAVREMNDAVGCSETKLIEEYPLTDADTKDLALKALTADAAAAIKYDYAFALSERKTYLAEATRAQEERVRQQELEALDMSVKEKSEEISRLKHALELRDLRRIAEEKERQAREDQKRKEREEAAEQMRVEHERKVAELEARRVARELEAAQAKELAEKRAAQEAEEAARIFAAAEELKARGPKRKTVISAKAVELEVLAKEIQLYEDSCRDAVLWKHTGPSMPQHIQEYEFSQKDPTLEMVRNLGPPSTDLVAQKYKIKSFFKSFHKVLIVARWNFLYYFEYDEKKISRPESLKASGACYLLGCRVENLNSLGKPFCVKLIPSVPRKPSKSSLQSTDENNVIFAFESKLEFDVFVQLMQERRDPPKPSRVEEYYKQHQQDGTQAE